MKERATLQSIRTSSHHLHDDATTLQNMSRGQVRTDGMLRDREYNNGGEDGKNTVATVRDTMRDEREESEKRPGTGTGKREIASTPFTSSCWPSPPTW